jgi:alpha-tubulin suppressor-like RCC1 family protein
MRIRSSAWLALCLSSCGGIDLATGVNLDSLPDAQHEAGALDATPPDASIEAAGDGPADGENAADDAIVRADVHDAPPETASDASCPDGQCAIEIAAGRSHVCAVMASGPLRCWGANECGQLGSGDVVDGGNPLGGPSVCDGSKAAVPSEGIVLPSKVAIPLSVEAFSSRPRIFAGWAATCALDAGEALQCWGRNQEDMLGRGAAGEQVSLDLRPQPVVGLGAVRAVALGSGQACAVEREGSLWCWGSYFQQGFQSTSAGEPARVVLSSGLSALAVSVGVSHACAVVSNGSVECWGGNRAGQLGRPRFVGTNDAGLNNPSFPPATVEGIEHAHGITATRYATCALIDGGGVLCWGGGSSGELGRLDDAGFIARDNWIPTPPVLPAGRTVQSLGAAFETFYAVLDDGSVWCWGQNAYGECNDEEKASDAFPGGVGLSSSLPIRLKGLSGAVQVVGGYYFACALLRTGAVQCWGLNRDDQLGIETLDDPEHLGSPHPEPTTVRF